MPNTLDAKYRSSSCELPLAAADAVPHLVWAADAGGRFEYLNRRFIHYAGRPPAELLGRNWAAVAHPDDQPRVAAAWTQALQSGDPFRAECRLRRADGAFRWHQCLAEPTRGLDGVVERWFGTCTDVEDDKRAEAARRTGEARLRALVEKGSGTALLLAADGAVLYASPAVARVTGCRSSEVAGQDAFHRCHPGDRGHVAERYARLLAAPGETLVAEYRHQHADGSWRWVEATWTNLTGDPDVGAVVASVHDVSDRHESEATRRRAAEVLDATTDGVFAVDREWRVTYLNPRAERFLRRGRGELLGRVLWDVFPEAVGTAFHREYTAALETGRPAVFEEDYPPLAARFEVRAFPAPDGLSVYFRDVTARRAAEAEARRTAELLRAVADGTTDAVFVKDRDGRYLFCNASMARLVGRPVEDALGRDDAALFDAASADRIREVDQRVMAAGRAETTEEVLTAGGITRTYLATKAPYRDGTGAVAGTVGISRDVTELARAQAEAREWRARYEAAVAATGQVLYYWDVGRDELHWGGTCERTLGYAPHEVPQTLAGWSALIHPEDRAAFDQEAARAVAAREPFRLEYRVRRKDGSYVVIEDTGHFIPDADGSASRMVGFVADVTERVATRRTVEDERRLLDAVLESLPVAVIIADASGRLVRMNRACDRVWGAGRPKSGSIAEYRDWVAWWPDTGRPVAPPEWALSRALTTGEACAGELVEIERFGDRDRRYVINSAAPVRDESGAVVGGVAATMDVTDRLAAEAALRHTEERFRAFMDHCPAAAFIKDSGGRYVYVNPTWLAQFDPPPTDWAGKTDHDLWPAATANQFRASDRECLARGAVVQIEETGPGPDGGPRAWLVMKFPLDGDGGPLVGGMAWDITDRRRAEDNLREQEGLLRDIVAHIPCGVFWKDRESRYLGCNDRVARDLGLGSGADVVGRTDADLGLDPAEAEYYRACDRQVIESCEPMLDIEETQTRPGGTTASLLTSKVPLRGAGGAVVGVLGVYQDVTERRRLEEGCRQAQKLEAVGKLAGGVAHDFNNLLTVINGYADIVLTGLHDGDPNRPMVEQVRKAGERAAGLTRQLLAFSRQQVLQQKVLDLSAVVADLTNMLGRVIGEDVELVTASAPGLWRVAADPSQLEQVVMNLAVNARDAMPTGGRLAIETQNVTLRRGTAQDGSEVRPGPYVVLSVSDTGCGMTAATRARIFEPFFTTKGPGQGTGLGLATVYGIVKQSGGHIQVESAVGRGTIFYVFLPATDAAAAADRPGGGGELPGGTETVLVVEDEPGVRRLTRLSLERLGYTVLAASGGAEAEVVARRAGRPIDLLLTDVVMPGASGRVLADRLVAEYPGLRVLFVSGYTDDAVVRHGVASDTVHFLHKPYSPAALARKVRDVLNAPSEVTRSRQQPVAGG